MLTRLSIRDIVLIDQRGTGKSNGLACKFGDTNTPDMIDPVKRDQQSRKLLAECRDQLAKRADLTLYIIGLNSGGSTWYEGDYNYDGVVDRCL